LIVLRFVLNFYLTLRPVFRITFCFYLKLMFSIWSYDHVVPPLLSSARSEQLSHLGFRVPAIFVSPSVPKMSVLRRDGLHAPGGKVRDQIRWDQMREICLFEFNIQYFCLTWWSCLLVEINIARKRWEICSFLNFSWSCLN
jgi:hypothetical protein